MRNILIGLSLLLSLSSFAGDMYMNCGKGSMETMEEFIATGILNNGEAHLIFTVGKISYSVVFDDNQYSVMSSDGNINNYKTLKPKAAGNFKESELFDGISCHIND